MHHIFVFMKSVSIITIVGAFGLLVAALSSCGSSRKVPVASYPDYTGAGNTGTRMVTKVEEQIDECEQMAIDAPASELRAYASAVDEDRDFARQQAVLFAKAEMASQIESLTLSVMKGYRAKVKSNGRTASESDIKQDVGTMAEQTLENCRIICSKRYRLGDGTYECAVCISVPSEEVEKVIGATVLSDDERQNVEFNAEQFRRSYADELRAMRQSRQNGSR